MQRLIKYKFYRYSLTALTSLLILAGFSLSQSHLALANTATALCFYDPPGITSTLYNCTSDSQLTPGDCYTNNGTPDSQGNFWIQAPNCSSSNFANSSEAKTPFCGDTGNSNPNCATSTQDQALVACPANDPGCKSLIEKYINPVTAFLAAGVGIIVTITIVIGAIQYATSQDNPQAVSAAKKRIFNAILALVLFALMYSLLNWLVPGGVFNGG